MQRPVLLHLGRWMLRGKLRPLTLLWQMHALGHQMLLPGDLWRWRSRRSLAALCLVAWLAAQAVVQAAELESREVAGVTPCLHPGALSARSLIQ